MQCFSCVLFTLEVLVLCKDGACINYDQIQFFFVVVVFVVWGGEGEGEGEGEGGRSGRMFRVRI